MITWSAFIASNCPKNRCTSCNPACVLVGCGGPIEKVGLYAPGGKAPYPSTVLMLGVPALVAGCQQRVLCIPPSPDGTLPPAMLVAADLVGIRDIFKIGGAQAIAAMAFGTETVPRVYKLFGPGSIYVVAAKIWAASAGCHWPLIVRQAPQKF